MKIYPYLNIFSMTLISGSIEKYSDWIFYKNSVGPCNGLSLVIIIYAYDNVYHKREVGG